ncbi:MAG: protein kinase [archaeon]|nr:protein kinase [archaeon]
MGKDLVDGSVEAQKVERNLSAISNYLEFVRRHFLSLPDLPGFFIASSSSQDGAPRAFLTRQPTTFFDIYNATRYQAPAAVACVSPLEIAPASSPATFQPASQPASSSSSSSSSVTALLNSTRLNSFRLPSVSQLTANANDDSDEEFPSQVPALASTRHPSHTNLLKAAALSSPSTSPSTPGDAPPISPTDASPAEAPLVPRLMPSFSFIRVRHLERMETQGSLLDSATSPAQADEDLDDWIHSSDPLPSPPRFRFDPAPPPPSGVPPEAPKISSSRCPEYQKPAAADNKLCLNCGFLPENHAYDSSERLMYKFSDLVLEEEMACGKDSSVWKGRLLSGGHVAVRVYRDPCLIQDFRREILGLSKLRHPNTLLFIGACAHEPAAEYELTQYMIITELCRSSLWAHLRSNPTESMESRLQMAIDACLGMIYLHSLRLVHCDLTIEKLLIKPTGVVVIGDLNSTCPEGTATGPVGTQGYIAPELVLGWSTAYTSACDVFSFAIIMYELFAAEAAWPLSVLDDLASYERALRSQQRPALSNKLNLPRLLMVLLASSWHEDPLQRPSFSAILDTLVELRALIQKKITRTRSLPSTLIN